MKSRNCISCLPALLFILLNIFSTHTANGQGDGKRDKVSPSLLEKINTDHVSGTYLFRLMIKGEALPAQLQLKKYNAYKIAGYDSVSFYMISATIKELNELVLPLSNVLYADDGNRTPKEEVQVNNLDLGTNKINAVHRKFPQWNGEGLTVSVKENRPDTTDIDFEGRYLSTSLTSSIFSSHATNMATMIAGGGNSWYLGKGAAWGATISSSDFANLLPDPTPLLQQYNISVQNHSYGVGIENFYGADAAAYDASLISNPSLVYVFSSGNSGISASVTGPYAGINGFANLTGSFKMAKNILTAGATDSFSNVALQSSKGPAYDGRVKPELVAFGIDGSSGAAALVSGVSLILQHEYKQMNGSLPANALIKAVLINSADDKGNIEVDYSNGFGSLNALNAIRAIQSGRFLNGTVSNGGVQNFPLAIPPGIKKLKITLVWNDPPAAANAPKALINDLDLELVNTLTNETWKPWVLNKVAHIDSLKQLAARKKDSLNNVEQVTIDNPIAGNYQVNVKGYSIISPTQNYFIAYQFDSTDTFEWYFPTFPDPVFPSAINTLRWKSSYITPSGKLDYSIDNGTTWQLINPAVDLSAGYYNWNTPGVTSTSLLKMTIGNVQISSDPFVISSRTQTGVGFNCPDSFLFFWNKLPAMNNYRVYKLGSRYMEPLLFTTDSFVVLKKNINPSLHYAVAPVINGREGVRSYTINYTIQGVDCYIRSFLASLIGNTVELNLSLGSLYNINKIVLEKLDGVSFKPIQEKINNTSLSIIFIDNNLTKGLNIYRIKLELAGGGIVYTLEERVFYFEGSLYIIYPNPAPQNSVINIAQ
ncbi:MAG TPA: S8 family serine peptidase, partial [Ferruginibacter sp.]|nr:S8 family serine peptidase [Ferruginibacter sp.]